VARRRAHTARMVRKKREAAVHSELEALDMFESRLDLQSQHRGKHP
jgi:hypothetical protein